MSWPCHGLCSSFYRWCCLHHWAQSTHRRTEIDILKISVANRSVQSVKGVVRDNAVLIASTSVQCQSQVTSYEKFQRIDFNIPVSGTLCYCDEFCDQHINPDCCPDYENVCKGAPDPIRVKCEVDGGFISDFEEGKRNCNLWWAFSGKIFSWRHRGLFI